jgi:hypothetical protein
MYHDQLYGCHLRLQRELASAYATEIWDSPRIHRLTRDLVEIDREIAALESQEEDGALVHASAAARANSAQSVSARFP